TIDLPPVTDTGFNDHNNAVTGCFPNQVASVTIDQGFAYVTSTCASPRGPLGVFQKGTCSTNADCAAFGVASICTGAAGAGLCTLACTTDADCGFGAPAGSCSATKTCGPNPQDVKSTTHPAVTVIDLSTNKATAAGTLNLDKSFVAKSSTRLPLLPTD